MNLAEFERLRADVSHRLLRNGVFYRLGANPSDVEAGTAIESRAKILAAASLEAITEQTNFKKAAATWVQGDAGFKSVSYEVLRLLKLARKLSDVTPGKLFPDVQEVAKHIERCDCMLSGIDKMFAMTPSKQQDWLLSFWREALVVSDALRSVGVHTSPKQHFWGGVFRSTTVL